MPTTATDLHPTSELRFISARGAPIMGPSEWEPCLLAIPCRADEWDEVALFVNGRAQPVSLRRVGEEILVVADWDRSGPGWYEIAVEGIGHGRKHQLRIAPAKLSEAAMSHLLEDLESRLPVTIAIALRDAGARIGISHDTPVEQTLATEIARLRRAVRGVPGRPGLVDVLHRLAPDPHRMLSDSGIWVRSWEARRPDPARLVQALWRNGNMEGNRPHHVIDRRVEHTVDLYENRLVKAFTTAVVGRLRILSGTLSLLSQPEVANEVAQMLGDVVAAQREAQFLEEVGALRTGPGAVTMVLLKRYEYRAAYEGYLDFRRRLTVHLDEPTLMEPLDGMPYLYQLWGALLVIQATVVAAHAAGFVVAQQKLVWPKDDGLYLKVLKDNRSALTMRRDDGSELRLFHERSYSRNSSPLRSISFSQRPDVALELRRPEWDHEVLVFDPKYKLDSETDAEPGDGKPKKVDIDKMHSYRDAIRDRYDRRVVEYAAILYPGETRQFAAGLAALRMYPGEEQQLLRNVESVIGGWIGDE